MYSLTMSTVAAAVMLPAANDCVKLAESGIAAEDDRPAFVEKLSGNDVHLYIIIELQNIIRCEHEM